MRYAARWTAHRVWWCWRISCGRAAWGSAWLPPCWSETPRRRELRLLNAGERLPAQGSVQQLYHALGLDAAGVSAAVKEVLA